MTAPLPTYPTAADPAAAVKRKRRPPLWALITLGIVGLLALCAGFGALVGPQDSQSPAVTPTTDRPIQGPVTPPPATTPPVTRPATTHPATTPAPAKVPAVQPSTPDTIDTDTQPAESGDDVYYPNCAAVRAAGKAPLYLGEPGYRAALDRDHDGVACE